MKKNLNFFDPDNILSQSHPLWEVLCKFKTNTSSQIPELPYFFLKNGKIALKHSDGELCYHLEKDFERLLSQKLSVKREPIAKALGIKGDGSSKVIDATTGSGKDTLLLLALGAKVIGFERNTFVELLWEASLMTLEDSKLREVIKDNYQFLAGTILDYKNETDFSEFALYFDPMFNDPKKKARSRKEMEVFKDIVGDDPDSIEFIKEVQEIGLERVVIKRADKCDPLIENPIHRYKGKTTTYDRY